MKKKKILLALLLLAGFIIFTGCVMHKNLSTNNINNNNEDKINNENNVIENIKINEDEDDYVIDTSNAIEILFNSNSIKSNSNNVKIDNNIVTINKAGVYNLSGNISDGQIIIDTDDKETVKIILNGVNITSKNSSPFYVKNAEKVVIALLNGSENYLTDSNSYTEIIDNEPNATIFSKSDLTIYGSENASLTVTGNYKDGISSKDGLIIKNAQILVESQDDGIRGKDYAVIENSNLMVTANDNGILSDNNEDENKGYILITDSNLDITAAGDGISAKKDIEINNDILNIISGGGSNNKFSEDESKKGIKAVNNIIINNGEININSADDSIHSNNMIVINSGNFILSSGDDGIHADTSIEINNGEINITKSYEGIESSLITINNGDIYIIASDDGLNVAGGNDSSAMGRPGAGGFDVVESGSYLYINGGYIYVNANGDGLDSNGSIVMTAGTVIVNGPINNGNGPLDYNGTFDMQGGYLLAVGSSGMAQAPSNSSNQYAILINLNSSQSAESLINIQNSTGQNILTFQPAKTYQSILISSADIRNGETYNIYVGGNASGTEINGLYEDGSYTNGDLYATITVSDIITTYGTSGMGGGMRGGMDPGQTGTMPNDDMFNNMQRGERGTRMK